MTTLIGSEKFVTISKCMLFKQEDHQSDIPSKASFMGPQAKLQREPNEAQQEAKATELQGTSQWRRGPVMVGSNSLSHQRRPFSVIAAVKKFWRRQIIATIPENECQDHFGTETPSFFLSISTFRHQCSHQCESLILKLSPLRGGLCTLTTDKHL